MKLTGIIAIEIVHEILNNYTPKAPRSLAATRTQRPSELSPRKDGSGFSDLLPPRRKQSIVEGGAGVEGIPLYLSGRSFVWWEV